MNDKISTRLALHYGSIALYTAILHNLFLLYHVDMFVSVYKIDKTSFWIGETIFLVWNSCNDPLFGWISDKKYLSPASNSDVSKVVAGRLRALTWNGPLFALSFLAFWFAWTFPSLQFAVCLCLYDGFLTMIDLHHSALLADLSVNVATRAHLKKYCSVFSAIGSLSVFVSYVFWTHGVGSSAGSLLSFQTFCVILACIAVIGFITSTQALTLLYNQKVIDDRVHQPTQHKEDGCGNMDIEYHNEKKAFKKFIWELAGHKNFLWFTAMNVVQVFHCHFNSNFFPLFIDSLLGDDIPPIVCSLLLGFSFMAPHINNLYFLTLCQRHGAYFVIRLLFFIKLVLGCVMFFVGFRHIWFVGLFIASNRVFTEGTCKLLNLVVSDLVDEDAVIHGRCQAVSALMFGTVAFLSKPGQTFAPLFGTWLLTVLTGHDVFATGSESGSIKLDMKNMSESAKMNYQIGVFNLLVTIPILCAGFQLFVWSRFTLHTKRLQWVKSVRSNVMKYSTV